MVDGQLVVKINKYFKKLAVKILEQIEPSNVLTARFLDNSQSTSTNISKNSQLRGYWSLELNFLDKKSAKKSFDDNSQISHLVELSRNPG